VSDLERIAVVIALVVATGFFTLAEYALVTTRRWRMQELADGGDRRATALLGLMNEPLRFIATIQLGISALGILGEAEETGVIEEAEEEMIYSVFDFAAAEARKVMIPRAKVAALSAALTVDEALAQVLDAPYTCHPVYDGDLDHMVGVLYLRDIFTAVHRGIAPNALLAELMRPAPLIPETKDLGALLAEFRLTRQQLAIVVGEHGATGAS
jgi:CBS domain containing-hemolysin-like protein